MVSHTTLTSYGRAFDDLLWMSQPARPLLRALVPMFFVLSGFLVAGSLERCRTLVSFMGLRVIRIMPALAVEVALSALLIGPLVSVEPLGRYVHDPLFADYLRNAVGDIHYLLPGVFGANPLPSIVNGQLWTVPYELYCYVALGVAGLIGIARNRRIAIYAAVASTAYIWFWIVAIGHVDMFATQPQSIHPPLLVPAFLTGVAFYLYRRDIPFSPGLVVVAAIAGLVGLAGPSIGEIAALVPLAYATVGIGLIDWRRSVLTRLADYSYGIYLYGFVVQQLTMHLLPGAREWYWNLSLSLPVATALAALSWHVVELPAARLRVPLRKVEDRWLRIRAKVAAKFTPDGARGAVA